MPLRRKTEEEKQAERAAREQAQAREQAAVEEEDRLLAKHVATLPKWEYYVESFNLTSHWSQALQAEAMGRIESKMDYLGEDGWELVGYSAMPIFGSVSMKQAGVAHIAVFKRLAIGSPASQAKPRATAEPE